MRTWMWLCVALLAWSCNKNRGSIDIDDTDTVDTGDPNNADADGDGVTVGEGDCNDGNPAVHPGAAEVCDGIDNDCDGLIDVADPDSNAPVWFYDDDGDGWGDDASSVRSCQRPEGYVEYGGDCDDGDDRYHPSADEDDCDDANDYNCDGFVGSTDNDGDGFAACRECNDGNASVNPSATEVCNGLDDDCDGDVDGNDDSLVGGTTYYEDDDADGFGNASETRTDCEQPTGYVATSGDCNDDDSTINPAATEQCDGFDNDCDGLVDSSDPDATGTRDWYADADSDGYGDGGSTVASCSQPAGYVANNSDCDDGNASVSPNDPELCGDGIDNDCDGLVDSDDPSVVTTWYRDADGDGWGDASSVSTSCEQPSGYVSTSGDCNDGNAAVNPAATEICNNVDDDCDGDVDSDDDSVVNEPTWYRDDDDDGYGDPDHDRTQCDQPEGFVSNDDDCDDDHEDINPGVPECCDNGDDDDCDGTVDESDCSDWC